MDQWYEMTEQDVREFEQQMHARTNEKIGAMSKTTESSAPTTPVVLTPKEAETPTKRGWFNWS